MHRVVLIALSLHINGNFKLPKQRRERLLLFFSSEGKTQLFSCSAELHIVHRVILRDFGESHGLAVVRLDVPNWLQRFWKSLIAFIIAFTALSHNLRLNVSQCIRRVSRCV